MTLKPSQNIPPSFYKMKNTIEGKGLKMISPAKPGAKDTDFKSLKLKVKPVVPKKKLKPSAPPVPGSRYV
jgi:hypothetical protein